MVYVPFTLTDGIEGSMFFFFIMVNTTDDNLAACELGGQVKREEKLWDRFLGGEGQGIMEITTKKLRRKSDMLTTNTLFFQKQTSHLTKTKMR